MADIPYGRDYPDPIWCDEDGQPMPPVGAELLDDIRAFLRRFVVYPSDHELIAHTLWIAHCWFMEAWDSTPRIAFLSPEPGSGKSRALEVTEPLVPRPVHAINCTPAYLFRRVADPVGRPTVLYDECDTLFGPKAKEHEEIRGVINAGHRKGAVAGRCVIRGKIVETEELPAYCAVALAGLDDLPDTIMSRSIVVRMRRRAPTEPVEPWRPRVNGPEAEKLHDRLATWAAAITVGAQHVLRMPEQEGELVRELAEAAESARDDGICGAVVAVIGGRGGAGASLFAVALAQAAADALLVDLDPWAGGIDLLVGGETAPGLRWPDLALQGGRLNWSAVRAALPRPRGISVLSGTRRGYELDAGPVDAVIDAGRRGGVTVVCDLPRRLTDATQAALDAADLVVLVSPCDVRACAAAATMAPVLTAINPNLGLVVRGPSPGGLRAAEVADVAGVPLLASMRAQPRLAEQLEHGGLRLRRRSVLASAARRVLGVLPRAGSGRHGRAA